MESSSSTTRAIPRWIKVTVGIITGLLLLILVAIWYFGPYIGVYLLPESPTQRGHTALRLMDSALFAEEDQWKQQRPQFEAEINAAQSGEEIDKILERAVGVAGGKHSHFIPAGVKDSENFGSYIDPTVSTENNIVTLKLPEMNPFSGKHQQYADTIVNGIDPKACGVIVDLRENTGGDMGPMIAGISPLIPDGLVTAFAFGTHETPVTLEKGRVQNGGTPVTVKQTTKVEVPIAVLMGPDTASSGEQALLAFRGLENAKTFGQPSAGYASVNDLINLSDGSTLVLTVGETKARTGERFGEEPIAPDETVPLDEAPTAAKEWLQTKGCGA